MRFFFFALFGLIAGFYSMIFFDHGSSLKNRYSNPEKNTSAHRGQPLGRIHNNYWNVKKPLNGGEWLGTVGYDQQGHAIFEDPAYGVRAAIRLLRNYQLRHKLTTIEEIIRRWAPPEAGNPVQEYILNVSRRVGLRPKDSVIFFDEDGRIKEMERLKKVMFAMAEFECGAGFKLKEDEFKRGVALYQS